MLYGVFRYLFLVHQREGGNPNDVLFTDRALLASVVLSVSLLFLGDLFHALNPPWPATSSRWVAGKWRPGSSRSVRQSIWPAPWARLVMGSSPCAMAIMLYLNYLTGLRVEVLGVREVAPPPRGKSRAGPARPGAPASPSVRCWPLVSWCWGSPCSRSPTARCSPVTASLYSRIGGNTRWVHSGARSALVSPPWGAQRRDDDAPARPPPDPRFGRSGSSPLAQFSGDMLAAILLAVGLSRIGRPLVMRWDLQEAGPVVRQGSWLVGNAVVGLLIYNSDLIFLRILRTSVKSADTPQPIP